MRFSVNVLMVLSTISLAACSGSSSNALYGDSRVLPDLEIPPDLTVETSDSGVELPSVISPDNRGVSEAGNKIPVLAGIDSIKLEGYANFYWLSVVGPVDDIYLLVKNFWASEGFTLSMDEPVIGIMQTNWVYSKVGTNDPDRSFLGKFFGEDDLSATQDQFKTRIARDAETGATQIYITHRGTEYIHVLSTKANEDSDTGQWGFRASDNDLEVEMLSRLMIYLGLEQSELEDDLVNIKLFAPRSRLEVDYSENETFLLLTGEYTRNWNRTLHQLERLNFEVVKSDIRSGLSNVGVMHVITDIDTKVDTSGFFSISTQIELQKKQIYLIFSEESEEITRVTMEDKAGEIDNSPEAVEFLTLLNEFLK